MALIKCKYCGADITDNSTKCYKCGKPNENKIENKKENGARFYYNIFYYFNTCRYWLI